MNQGQSGLWEVTSDLQIGARMAAAGQPGKWAVVAGEEQRKAELGRRQGGATQAGSSLGYGGGWGHSSEFRFHAFFPLVHGSLEVGQVVGSFL